MLDVADAASCSRARSARDGYTVYVRPELVVEIAFNDVQAARSIRAVWRCASRA